MQHVLIDMTDSLSPLLRYNLTIGSGVRVHRALLVISGLSLQSAFRAECQH